MIHGAVPSSLSWNLSVPCISISTTNSAGKPGSGMCQLHGFIDSWQECHFCNLSSWSALSAQHKQPSHRWGQIFNFCILKNNLWKGMGLKEKKKIPSYFWSISFHLFLLLSNSRSYMNIFSTGFCFKCPDRVFAKQQLIPSQMMNINKSAQIPFVNLQLHYMNTYQNLSASDCCSQGNLRPFAASQSCCWFSFAIHKHQFQQFLVTIV